MDSGDIALVAIVGYVAVIALARLMIRRRRQLVDELLGEAQRRQESRKEA